jgi:hypothetical protein
MKIGILVFGFRAWDLRFERYFLSGHSVFARDTHETCEARCLLDFIGADFESM